MSVHALEELRKELRTLARTWQIGPRHGAELEEVRWTPVTIMRGTPMMLGLSADAWWVTAGPSSVTEFKPGSRPIFLLPLLDYDLSGTREWLADELAAAGLPAKALDTLPFEAIVVTAMESSSEELVKRALNWASNLPSTPSLLDALQVQANSGPTQQIRQAARKLRNAMAA